MYRSMYVSFPGIVSFLKIRFQESDTLSPGSGLAKFETSKCCKCSWNEYLNLPPFFYPSLSQSGAPLVLVSAMTSDSLSSLGCML